ncbi:hypothetical protein Tco_0739136 [Tanacetum coccineum]
MKMVPHEAFACSYEDGDVVMRESLGKMTLDVDFFMERGTSPSIDEFSWSFIDSKLFCSTFKDSNLFSRSFNTSKLLFGTFNTSKLFSGIFKKCIVLKLQALAWKDNDTQGNIGYEEDLKVARMINKLCVKLSAAIEEHHMFTQELTASPGWEITKDKTSEFL